MSKFTEKDCLLLRETYKELLRKNVALIEENTTLHNLVCELRKSVDKPETRV